MASKQGGDQSLELQGFLNDLQDWELSLKGNNDKKKKPQPSTPTTSLLKRNLDSISRISSAVVAEDGNVDAASEKELGNEYFKQKKFKEAMECYSRSIALSPTAVSYANRAMAYLKLRQFKEAEDDCTEALNLDDRYIKAYSRRATARKELGKLKESIEDSEFALGLEPNNQEIMKQYSEVKSLYELAMLQRVSKTPTNSVQGTQMEASPKTKAHAANSVGTGSQISGASGAQSDKMKGNEGEVLVQEIENKRTSTGSRNKELNVSHADTAPSAHMRSIKRDQSNRKQNLKPSIQELASKAASLAMAEAATNMKPPSSAYEFEILWRGFSGDQALQARLLKVTSPSALPWIFKNALSTNILIDIITCVSSFFNDDMDLAVKYLENLTKVPRFSILIMCLSSKDKADLRKLWDEVLCSKATPMEYAEILDGLRSLYCLE